MNRNICLRLSVLMLLLALSVSSVRSQSADETIRPSANALQAFSGSPVEVGLHTGQIGVRIPLFTLPGLGIDIPITLSFSNAGITHQSEASPFGLGWSVLAGGVITTTINGNEDWKNTSQEKVPWQYDRDYLRRKWQEQNSSPYQNDNLVVTALNGMVADPMPDDYKYSFCGHSGSIVPTYNDYGSLVWKLYPDDTFRMRSTENGYVITGDDGNDYYFETKEYNHLRSDGRVSAWHLSRIETSAGGTVTFTYREESALDFRIEQLESSQRYPTQKLMVLTRIDSDLGSVRFYAPRRKPYYEPNDRRIMGIELLAPDGSLVKGFELNAGDPFTNDEADEAYNADSNYRKSLKSVIEYDADGNYLPGYSFEYDYYFARSKASDKPYYCAGCNNMRGSWAKCPGLMAIVDRNLYGNPACWSENIGTPQEMLYGFEYRDDYTDFTFKDYFCLTRISFPTGGSEVFEYEPHDYRHVGNIKETVVPPSAIAGRRIAKRAIYNQDGTGQRVLYKYVIHDADYSSTASSKGSGVLVTPSIHTSVAFKPTNERGRWRLGAVPVTTDKPQNCLEGPIVCYTEVEEVFTSLDGTPHGRKISYFEKQVADPPLNYVFMNYALNNTSTHANLLVPIANRIYDNISGYPSNISLYDTYNYTYMAYPMGKFSYPSRMPGKPQRELVLDTSDRVVKKTEYVYAHGESPRRYGYLIQMYDDTNGYNAPFRAYRYLISQTTHYATYSRLSRQTVTEYIWDNMPVLLDSIVEEKTWAYSGTRLLEETYRLGKGKTMRTEYVYPDMVENNAIKKFTLQAFALVMMRDGNDINRPVQVARYADNQCVDARFYSYREYAGRIFGVDSVLYLKAGFAGQLPKPSISGRGHLVRHDGFEWEASYRDYGKGRKPKGICYRNRPPVALLWKDGHYLMLKAEGCEYQSLYDTANAELQQQLSVLHSCQGVSEKLVSFNQYIRQALPKGTQVTTYTYFPLIGLASETDPALDARYYTYDRFNRLSETRDRGNLLIEEHTYHYPGQRDL